MLATTAEIGDKALAEVTTMGAAPEVTHHIFLVVTQSAVLSKIDITMALVSITIIIP